MTKILYTLHNIIEISQTKILEKFYTDTYLKTEVLKKLIIQVHTANRQSSLISSLVYSDF